MNQKSFTSLSKRIENMHEQVIQIQSELTLYPALAPENGGEGEAKKADYIKQLLKRCQIDYFEELNAPDDRVPAGYRPNLIGKIKGKSDQRTIWIMSHIDIVPPGDDAMWDTDPYQVVEKDGKLYGRGTEDNQQGIVSSIIAIKALQEENIKSEYDIGLVLVSDEETGSIYGIDYVLRTKPELFHPNDLIIIPDAGNASGTMIEVAEKSILWMKCETHGKQTHGSTPEKGRNAHKVAAYLIVKMNELYEIFDYRDSLFDPPISTFEPTKKETNVDNINTIPGVDVSYFDCRVLPKFPLQDVLDKVEEYVKEIEKTFDVTIKLSYPQKIDAPPPTPPNSPVAVSLKQAVKDVLERDAKTIGIGGGTVAAFFREAGFPAVCWCTVEDTMHSPNEYCRINNVINDARIFAHVFLQV